MKSKLIREFVYRYNGDAYSQQVIQDQSGMMPMHLAGEILHRDGKEWRVAVVQNEYPFAGSTEIFRQRVYLTNHI
jgi:hypothetical protein